MEFAISSQASSLIRWILALVAIYMVLPAIIFRISGDSLIERFFARYVRMIALSIILGYFLVVIKLYELISLIAVFILLVGISKLSIYSLKHAFQEIRARFILRMYDFLDGLSHPYRWLRHRINYQYTILKLEIKKFELTSMIETSLLISVIAYATYLRFLDTLRHAAPGMSDAYVTLAWMKYISYRELFHDGIYPQGFHICLSIIHKLAACDALYILKYTGPLNGVLTTLGIYLLVTKLTGRKVSGVLSAFVFGVLGESLPLEWDRQGSSNSQEFALVFLLPAWLYTTSFLQKQEKKYLWTAAAAFLIIGLVHPLVLAFLWIGLACIIFSYLLLNFRQTLYPAGQLIAVAIFAGLAAALPTVVALLAGQEFHSSSVEFLKMTLQVGTPVLTLIDKIALVGFLMFAIMTMGVRRAGYNPAASLYIFLIGCASFLMYLLVGPMSGNAVLAGRMGILWSLISAVGVGICSETLLWWIPGKLKNQKLIAAGLALVLMVWAVTYYKPSPTQPYKMQYDIEINQYLRLSSEFTPFEWTIVSSIEGYSLALGKGWHINLSDFLTWYDPLKSTLVRNVDGKEVRLNIQDLFIFSQKELFMVDMKEMKGILAQRALDYEALEQLVTKYKEYHDNLSVYYEDDSIVIYRINQPKSKTELFQQIWGSGG